MQLVKLDREALPDRADPCIADKCHSALPQKLRDSPPPTDTYRGTTPCSGPSPPWDSGRRFAGLGLVGPPPDDPIDKVWPGTQSVMPLTPQQAVLSSRLYQWKLTRSSRLSSAPRADHPAQKRWAPHHTV